MLENMGAKIRAHRLGLKMTLAELGNKVSVGASTVRKWETGDIKDMKSDKIQKVAEALEVTPSYLMGWREPDEKGLTPKDHNDIAKTLNTLVAKLEQSGDLMFDGDPMSPEAKDSIISAMRVGLEMAKVKNKERFTPKKYKE